MTQVRQNATKSAIPGVRCSKLSQPPNLSQPRIGKLTNCPNRPTNHQVFSHRARWRRQPQSLPTADSCPLSLTTGLRHDHVIKLQSLFRKFSTTTPTQRGFIIVYFPPVFSPQNVQNTPFRRGIKNHKTKYSSAIGIRMTAQSLTTFHGKVR